MHLYDIAEEDIKRDKLGYQNYVDELYQLIKQAFADRKSLNIGVVGAWGDGKTTAVKMCLTKLKQHFVWYKKLNWIFFILVLVSILIILFIYSNKFEHLFFLIKSNHLILHLFKYVIRYLPVILFPIVLFYKQIFNSLKRLNNSIKKTLGSIFFHEDYIEIWFSPWSCSDDRLLMQEYLKAIAEAFGFDFGVASRLFLRYSKLLVGKDLSWISSLFDPTSNLSELKRKIENKLKDSNKRIVVIIDDLDRIQCEEIYNVLKLIGSVANFPNVINILAYDKHYIVEELKNCIPSSIEKDKASKYIEKIVNIECPLPKIEDITLKEYLFTHLDKMIERKND